MTEFWIVVFFLLLAALIFVVPPLFKSSKSSSRDDRRDLNVGVYKDQMTELKMDLENDIISQEQFEFGQRELESRLLGDVSQSSEESSDLRNTTKNGKLAPLMLIFGMPAFAILMYNAFGNPSAINFDETALVQNEPTSQHDMAGQLESLLARLIQKLQDDPEYVEGWVMLGRSYVATEKFTEALFAFERAVALRGNDAQILADYADAIAMAGNKSLEGKPLQLISKALTINPLNQKALWLAGTAAYERKDFEAALKYWLKLREIVPPNSEAAATMEANIEEARTLALQTGVDVDVINKMVQRDSGVSTPVGGVSSSSRVSGLLKISSDVLSKVDREDTVFLFARAAQGPRMPLAIQRAQVKDLPMTFTLDDSMAVSPNMKLSGFQKVVVVARISKSGNATPQSGDFEINSDVVQLGKNDIELIINQVIP